MTMKIDVYSQDTKGCFFHEVEMATTATTTNLEEDIELYRRNIHNLLHVGEATPRDGYKRIIIRWRETRYGVYVNEPEDLLRLFKEQPTWVLVPRIVTDENFTDTPVRFIDGLVDEGSLL